MKSVSEWLKALCLFLTKKVLVKGKFGKVIITVADGSVVHVNWSQDFKPDEIVDLVKQFEKLDSVEKVELTVIK